MFKSLSSLFLSDPMPRSASPAGDGERGGPSLLFHPRASVRAKGRAALSRHFSDFNITKRLIVTF